MHFVCHQKVILHSPVWRLVNHFEVPNGFPSRHDDYNRSQLEPSSANHIALLTLAAILKFKLALKSQILKRFTKVQSWKVCFHLVKRLWKRRHLYKMTNKKWQPYRLIAHVILWTKRAKNVTSMQYIYNLHIIKSFKHIFV